MYYCKYHQIQPCSLFLAQIKSSYSVSKFVFFVFYITDFREQIGWWSSCLQWWWSTLCCVSLQSATVAFANRTWPLSIYAGCKITFSFVVSRYHNHKRIKEESSVSGWCLWQPFKGWQTLSHHKSHHLRLPPQWGAKRQRLGEGSSSQCDSFILTMSLRLIFSTLRLFLKCQ